MSKSLVEMAADIIQAQSATKSMTPEEIALALQSTYKALQNLQVKEQNQDDEQEVQSLALTPEKSIMKNKVVCLECGQEFKVLSPKHLESHNLDGRQYRQKYGFKLRQPLCAKALSASRKKAGKARGIPDNLKKSIAEKKGKPAAKAKPVTKRAAAKKTKEAIGEA
ncbi:MAG: MucR family transcriptional regulator [Desulfobacteraceae bacterium]|nr:MucR family transcriptional regulator [Desulfobacteraceae bacterium]